MANEDPHQDDDCHHHPGLETFPPQPGAACRMRHFILSFPWLSFPEERRPAFDALFSELCQMHTLDTEQKWEAINNGYSRMNFLLDWLHRILVSSAATFDVIAVHKGLYRLWNEPGGDPERAFYITYTQVLTSAAERTGDETRIFIDNRSDGYARHPEVVQIVGNHMLKDLADAGRLGDVTKINSKEEPAIQVADFLTGLITAAHRDRLDPAAGMHAGKRLVMARAAESSAGAIWCVTRCRGHLATSGTFRSSIGRRQPLAASALSKHPAT